MVALVVDDDSAAHAPGGRAHPDDHGVVAGLEHLDRVHRCLLEGLLPVDRMTSGGLMATMEAIGADGIGAARVVNDDLGIQDFDHSVDVGAPDRHIETPDELDVLR